MLSLFSLKSVGEEPWKAFEGNTFRWTVPYAYLQIVHLRGYFSSAPSLLSSFLNFSIWESTLNFYTVWQKWVSTIVSIQYSSGVELTGSVMQTLLTRSFVQSFSNQFCGNQGLGETGKVPSTELLVFKEPWTIKMNICSLIFILRKLFGVRVSLKRSMKDIEGPG